MRNEPDLAAPGLRKHHLRPHAIRSAQKTRIGFVCLKTGGPMSVRGRCPEAVPQADFGSSVGSLADAVFAAAAMTMQLFNGLQSDDICDPRKGNLHRNITTSGTASGYLLRMVPNQHRVGGKVQSGAIYMGTSPGLYPCARLRVAPSSFWLEGGLACPIIQDRSIGSPSKNNKSNPFSGKPKEGMRRQRNFARPSPAEHDAETDAG